MARDSDRKVCRSKLPSNQLPKSRVYRSGRPPISLERLKFTEREMVIAHRILKEIRERLGFLVNVGLDYLTLDRAAATLSGGEGQRIRLATQIGSGLVGVLYILDEPSIGLHQRDNRRLLRPCFACAISATRWLSSSMMRKPCMAADYILDMGPGAGSQGGHDHRPGHAEPRHGDPHSLTGQYLRGDQLVSVPQRKRKAKGFLVSGRRMETQSQKTSRSRFHSGC